MFKPTQTWPDLTNLVSTGAQAHVGSHVHQEVHDIERQFAYWSIRCDQLRSSSIDSEEDEVQTSCRRRHNYFWTALSTL